MAETNEGTTSKKRVQITEPDRSIISNDEAISSGVSINESRDILNVDSGDRASGNENRIRDRKPKSRRAEEARQRGYGRMIEIPAAVYGFGAFLNLVEHEPRNVWRVLPKSLENGNPLKNDLCVNYMRAVSFKSYEASEMPLDDLEVKPTAEGDVADEGQKPYNSHSHPLMQRNVGYRIAKMSRGSDFDFENIKAWRRDLPPSPSGPNETYFLPMTEVSKSLTFCRGRLNDYQHEADRKLAITGDPSAVLRYEFYNYLTTLTNTIALRGNWCYPFSIFLNDCVGEYRRILFDERNIPTIVLMDTQFFAFYPAGERHLFEGMKYREMQSASETVEPFPLAGRQVSPITVKAAIQNQQESGLGKTQTAHTSPPAAYAIPTAGNAGRTVNPAVVPGVQTAAKHSDENPQNDDAKVILPRFNEKLALSRVPYATEVPAGNEFSDEDSERGYIDEAAAPLPNKFPEEALNAPIDADEDAELLELARRRRVEENM